MIKLLTGLLLVAMTLFAQTAFADVVVVIIDGRSLPYDLGESKYDNSPMNYANSSSNYANSDSNYENSSSNYTNSSSNYENGIGGKRRIISGDNKFLGYYVFGSNGLMNLFNAAGKRVAYMPGGGHTQSFFTDNSWCGTIGEQNGRTVLGLSSACYYRFVLDQ